MEQSTKFITTGGRPLVGEFEVFGAKNAALPVLAATLLTKEPCIIRNVPRILDVERMLELITSLGADISWRGSHEVEIEARDLSPENFVQDLVPKLRASVLLLGPLLARFGEVSMPYPGGDQIGARTLDTHLEAFRDFGISVREENGKIVLVNESPPASAHIVLREFSVTTTENALLFAASLPIPVTISLAAAEPHVADLCAFLVKLGVHIRGEGTHTVTILGGKKFGGATHRLIPDSLEAGTVLIGAAATRGEVAVGPAYQDHMLAVIRKLGAFGPAISFPDGQSIKLASRGTLRGTSVQAMPYPGIPSDLQAPFGVLGTQADGVTRIHDPLYEGRFRYIGELKRMGARAFVANPHEAYIMGPSKLFGIEIPALDIRSGAALVIAGLLAEGETVIHNAELIDRGYERLEERLRALGADIRRVIARPS